MKENTWLCNISEEVWMNCEEFETKEEAIEFGKKEFGGLVQFHVGQVRKVNVGVGVNVDSVIEDVYQSVYDEFGEVAESYLDNVHNEHASELESLLNDALHYWMDKHDYKPKYFRVVNIECISLDE